MIAEILIPLPSVDASTFAGQMQWFLYGYGYSAVIGTVAMMVRLFRLAGQSAPEV